MRLVAPLSLLASSALAALQEVSLFVTSDNPSINGSGVRAPHEGAGINYLFDASDGSKFVNANTIPLVYNTTYQGLFWKSQPDLSQYFGVSADGSAGYGIAQLSIAVSGTGVTFKNGFLAYEGSTKGFYALGNISDPYNYSKGSLAIVRDLDASPKGGIPISLTAVFGGASSAPPAPPSTKAPVPSSTKAPALVSTVATQTITTSAAKSTTTVAVIYKGNADGAIVPGTFLGAAALVAGLLM
ncbi:hypothetical protein DFJ63DRAFT_334965 [Scheffersomyces coipomensis]|uniref:uncharacterized protein n=1 Tax=Scheffersomyces coipomensis TaxID=1788519 RepID=UPI00315D6A2A